MLIGSALAGAGCGGTSEAPALPLASTTAEVSVTLPAVHRGANAIQAASAEALVLPATRAQAVLGRQSVSASRFGEFVVLPVNLGSCAAAGQPCQAVLVVRLLAATGTVIDSLEAGPFPIVGGGRTVAPLVQPRVAVRLTTPDTTLRLSFSTPSRLRVDAIDAVGTTLPFRSYAWQSGNPAVATVDSTGLISARGVGRTTITASREGVSVSVPVVAPAVERLQLTAPATSVMAKMPLRLQVAIEPAPGVSRAIRLVSSDTSVATVDTALNVTARRDGTVRFTARSVADTSVSATLALTVTPFQAAVSWRSAVSADRGPLPGGINGLWGADDQAIWAAGCWYMNFFDGTSWRPTPIPAPQGFCLNTFTGTSRTDVYAVGNQIWRFDGQTWSRLTATFSGQLWSAAMVGDEVVAVGENGLVLRGKGNAWRTIPSGTTRTLRRISSDGTMAYITGDDGTLLRYADGQLVSVVVGNAPQWNDVLVRSASEVYVAGVDFSVGLRFLVQRFDGRTWTVMPASDSAACCQMRQLHRTTDGFFAVGDNNVIFRWNGSRWIQESRSQVFNVNTGFSSGSTLMLGGWNSVTFIRRQGSWTRLTSNPSYNAVWGASPDFIVAGGSGGIDVFDGTRWSAMPGDIYRQASSMWGSSPRNIWAVGWPDTFMRYDGTAWRQAGPTLTANTNANGIWGTAPDSVWAVLSNGDILRFNGSMWQTIYRARTNLNAIHGTGGRHLIAVGNEGRIFQFNGRLWLQEDSGVDENIRAVWVVDSSQAFAIAGSKLLERRDGVWRSWTWPGGWFNWISGSGARDVYAGGSCSHPILRYDGIQWRPVEAGTVNTSCSTGGFVFPTGGVIVGGNIRSIWVGSGPNGVAPGFPR